jgi:tetratricopeptide (TPR) repeat protein
MSTALPFRQTRTLRRALAGIGLVIAALVFAAPAAAQDSGEPKYVEPTERQITLNEQAVRALAAGDAVKAVSLLEESNYIAELNVTYLNLGRSYQQLGRCEKARESFEMVFEAPQVETPPPGFVESKARTYLEEVEQSCQQEQASKDTDEDGAAAQSGDAQGDDPRDVEPDEAVIPGEEIDEPPAKSTPNKTTSIILLGSGVALIGGGVAVHFVAQGVRAPLRDPETNADGHVSSLSQQEAMDTESRANNLDVAAISVGAAGLAVAGIGAFMLFGGGESEPTTSMSAGPVDGGWAFGFQKRF